jgi:hypothetical protein
MSYAQDLPSRGPACGRGIGLGLAGASNPLCRCDSDLAQYSHTPILPHSAWPDRGRGRRRGRVRSAQQESGMRWDRLGGVFGVVHSRRGTSYPRTDCKAFQEPRPTRCGALIVPFQQIIGHPVENLCPFAEGAQSVARFFGQLLSNPPGARQAHNGRKGGFFGSDIFSGAFA